MPSLRPASAAFTRIDAVALTAVLCLAVLLLLPLHAITPGRAALTRCLSNMRELTSAWSLYSQDSGGLCVQNPHGGAHQGGHWNTSVWATGWLDWSTLPDNTNTALVQNARFAALAPYLITGKPAHKCPADTYLSRAQRARGWSARVRSVVMNASIGGINSDQGAFDAIFAKILKTSDLLYPSPAETILFLEEHPDSINDPSAFSPYTSNWIDVPASFHEGGGTFTFIDGHVEVHNWHASARNFPVKAGVFSTPRVKPGDPDILWMRYHSARKTAQFN